MSKTFTTFDIAEMLDVYPTTIANWIDGGKLDAYTTPGGHRRVTSANLLIFLKKHNMPVPDILKQERRLRILIVEDDPAVQKIISRILGKFSDKYNIASASSGFQAGVSLSLFKPEMVILDLMLPGIDGFEICSMIKKMNDDTRIIAITGNNDPEFRKKIMSRGADAFIGKPFDKDVMIKTVEELLKNR